METYFKYMTAESGTREKLVQDLKVLLHDAEHLITSAGRNLSDRSKAQLVSGLDRMKVTCEKLEATTRSTVRVTDRYVREHPYQTVGAALAIGLLIGVLVSRD